MKDYMQNTSKQSYTEGVLQASKVKNTAFIVKLFIAIDM